MWCFRNPSRVRVGVDPGWAFAWRSLMAGELLVIIAERPSLGASLEFARQFSRHRAVGHDACDPDHRNAGRWPVLVGCPFVRRRRGWPMSDARRWSTEPVPRCDPRVARSDPVRWHHAGVRPGRLRDARSGRLAVTSAEDPGQMVKARSSPADRGSRRSSWRDPEPVASQRSGREPTGADGGYRLARSAQEITVADVIRSLEDRWRPCAENPGGHRVRRTGRAPARCVGGHAGVHASGARET